MRWAPTNTLIDVKKMPDCALVSAKQLSALTGRSKTSLWRDIKNGFLPKPRKIGCRSARWSIHELKKYLNGQTHDRN